MLNESTLGLDTLAVKLRKYLMRLLMRQDDGGWVRGVKMQGWMHKETDYQIFNPINFPRRNRIHQIRETAVPRGLETICTV